MVHNTKTPCQIKLWLLPVAGVLVMLLTGCVTHGVKPSSKESDAPANEALLKAAGNYAGLILLYKTRLQQARTDAENKKCRLQLGSAYLQTSDPESTLFIMKPLLGNQQNDAQVWLLKSQALLAMGKPEEALKEADTALRFAQGDPIILNQQGLAYAGMGQYTAARVSINKARETLFDDLIIKNNLAMLDILEQKYDSAIKRLMPLYTSGQADERIKANLIIALARAGLYNEFKTITRGARSEQETMSLFITLSSAHYQQTLPTEPH